MARPLAVAGAAYFAALLLAVQVGLNLAVTIGVLCFLAFLGCLLVRPLRRYKGAAAVLLFAAGACTVYACAEALYVRPLAVYDGTTQTLRLQITGLPENHGTYSIYAARVTGGALPAGTAVSLFLSERSAPEPYDTVEAACSLHLYDVNNQKERGYRAEGILFSAGAEEGEDGVAVVADADKPWYAFTLYLRRYALDTVGRHLSGDVAGLVQAMCFGEKWNVSGQARGDFRDAGVSHLLVVSGLHMSILSLGLFSLLKRLRVSRRLAAGITAPVTLLFLAVLGFPPSATRAGVMAILLMLGLLIGREADSLNSLGLAVLLLLMPNPYAVLDAGLQLSFAATLGLLVVHPWLKRKAIAPLCERLCPPGCGRVRHALLAVPVEIVGVTFAATAPLLPLLAALYGSLSLAAPAANLLMVPVAPVVLLCGCLAVVFSPLPWLTFAVKGCFAVAGLTVRYFLAVAHAFASWPWAVIRIREPYQLLWIPAALGLLWLGWRLMRGHGLRVAAALSVIALLGGMLTHGLFMRGVTVITVQYAKGGAAVLLERDGLTGLIVTECDFLTPLHMLQERGIHRLDFLLMTDEIVPNEWFLPEFAENTRTDCLLLYADDPYESEGEELDTDRFGGLAERGYWLGRQPMRFWDDGRIEWCPGGWLRIGLGATRLLICPRQGDAAALDPDWRLTHLAVYTGDIPARAPLITAQGGVVTVDEKEYPALNRAIPWGMYPIEVVMADETTAMTRGQGDLQLAGQEARAYAAQ